MKVVRQLDYVELTKAEIEEAIKQFLASKDLIPANAQISFNDPRESGVIVASVKVYLKRNDSV